MYPLQLVCVLCGPELSLPSMAPKCLSWTQRLSRRFIIVVVAVACCLPAMVAAIVDEPLHEDEALEIYLASGDDVAAAIKSNFNICMQPPLNLLLHRLVLGPSASRGRIVHRTVPLVFGILSLCLLASIMSARGAFVAAATATLTLGLAPLFVRLSAYVRPYTVAVFFMLAFLVTIERWQRTNDRRWLVPMALVAVLLPLARTGEPMVFLLSLFVVQIGLGVASGNRVPDWPSVVLVGASLSLSLAISRFLVGGDPAYRSEGLDALVANFPRLWTDYLPVAARVFAPWPLALGLLGLATMWRSSRRALCRSWWLWVLWLTCFLFAVGYCVKSAPWLIVRERYIFSALVPFAATIGVLAATALRRASRRPTPVNLMALLLVLTWLGNSALRLGHDLTRQSLPDYRRAAEAVQQQVDEDTTILFLWNDTRRFPEWMRVIEMAAVDLWLVGDDPARLDESGKVAILTARVSLPTVPDDWAETQISPSFFLYRSRSGPVDRTQLIEVLGSIAEDPETARSDPRLQGHLAVVTAVLEWASGLVEEGDRRVEKALAASPLERTTVESLLRYCSPKRGGRRRPSSALPEPPVFTSGFEDDLRGWSSAPSPRRRESRALGP